MKIKRIVIAAVMLASTRATAFAADNETLPQNAWERVTYVYNAVCHMPAEMARILIALAAVIILTAIYYFACARGKDRGEE